MLHALKSGYRASLGYMLFFGSLSLSIYFFLPEPLSVKSGDFPFVNNQLAPHTCAWLNLLAFGVLMFQMYKLSDSDEVLKKHNFIPVFLVLVLWPLMGKKSQWDLNLWHQCFCIISFRGLFATYRKDFQERKLFDAAFYLGLDYLLCGQGLVLLGLFIVTLFRLRSFKWKEVLSVGVGYAAPLIVYSLVNWYMEGQFDRVFYLTLNFKQPHDFEWKAALVYSQFLLGFICIAAFEFMRKNKIGVYAKQHTMHQLLALWMFWNLIQSFCLPNSPYQQLSYSLVPLSLYLGEYFALSKREAFWNTILGFVLLFLIIESTQDRWHWF